MKLTMDNPAARYAHPFVDGVEVQMCFEADEEAGTAYCYIGTREGGGFRPAALEKDLPPDALIHEGVLYEIKRGVVEIRFEKPEHRALAERYA